MKFKKFYEEILVQRILRQNRLHHGLKIIPLILINSRNRVYHSLFLKFMVLINVVEIMNRGKTENGQGLRVVQTQVILFLKSMSERGGSGIKRLWIWIFNRFWLDPEIRHSDSKSLYIGSDSFRHWLQKLNGLGLNYP